VPPVDFILPWQPQESLLSGRIPFHLDACAHDAVFHSIIVSTEGNSRKTIRRYRRLGSNDVSPRAVSDVFRIAYAVNIAPEKMFERILLWAETI
jgi:hypothetical protein